jgi:hypothetical protein
MKTVKWEPRYSMWRDRHDEVIVAFHNSVKAPNNQMRENTV